jgi:acetolactate synthase I/II/III large subunit
MRIADIVVERLVQWGVTDNFSVTGGAAMHLNDAVGKCSKINTCYMHHEQACAMAAEGYAQISRKPALVTLTAGPGAINALNGVFGSFTDSLPMIILSGQSRSNSTKSFYSLQNLRQLGDQEAPIQAMATPIVKLFSNLTEQDGFNEVIKKIDQLVLTSISGRQGPVWLEIPVDIQGKEIDLRIFPPVPERQSEPLPSELEILDLIEAINCANRPVFLLGSGFRNAANKEMLIDFARKHSIPIMTAWAHDIISSDDPLFVGRPGTIGTRPGNLILQSCDLLIVVGSRMNIRQISYNWNNFAPNAKIIQVDIDIAELNKPFPRIDIGIWSSATNFVFALSENASKVFQTFSSWLSKCAAVHSSYEPKLTDYPVKSEFINVYHLIPTIFEYSPENSVFVSGNASACIVPFQVGLIRSRQRLFSNSGSASMGFDLPAAIGAALADDSRKIVCFAGDGSIMMNLQELQTIRNLQLNILIVVLENGGYLSIRQTQSNFFGKHYGASSQSGITFPNFLNIFAAFDIDGSQLDENSWKDQVKSLLAVKGPRFIVAKLDPTQEFEPRLKSRLVDGKIQTPELDDMFPFWERSHLDAVRQNLRNT